MNNLTLYELIKKTSQEKGRPLKIVCNGWNEVLRPLLPLVVYANAEFKNNISFEEFFQRFWEIAEAEETSNGDWKIKGIKGSKEEKEAFERSWYKKHLQMERLKVLKSLLNKDQDQKVKNKEEKTIIDALVSDVPFLSPAEDLLKALKEGMISELVFLGSYRKGNYHNAQGVTTKKKIFAKTWTNFPQCWLELNESKGKDWEALNSNSPHWEFLRNKYPDFDILVDHNPSSVKEFVENLPSDKIYALCDYKCKRGIIEDNNSVYFIPVTVSLLKDEDFEKGVQEYQQKNSTQLTSRTATTPDSEREREREHMKTTLSLFSLY